MPRSFTTDFKDTSDVTERLFSLLRRVELHVDHSAISNSVTDRNVLVTGAGGSIGCTLCHQLLKYNPRSLVLFEQSEHALFQVLHSLLAAHAPIPPGQILPLLGSIEHEDQMLRHLNRHEVDVVYHAAAYKHVDLAESNITAYARTNVLGTAATLSAAIDSDISAFVLVSSDKAIDPVGILGATKRFAEVVTQVLERRHDGTKACSIRLANVLNSSGSVVPRLMAQLETGEPLRITHRDAARYFMTAGEAATSIMQATTLAGPGDVLAARIERPLRIIDLAEHLAQQTGTTLQEIGIQLTGLRPGERVLEKAPATGPIIDIGHPDIVKLNLANPATTVDVSASLVELRSYVDSGADLEIRQFFNRFLPEAALAEN